MTNKDFDKKLGDKLREFDVQPPEDMFARIEETLAGMEAPAPTTGVRKNGVWTNVYRYVAAAAIIAVAVVLSLRTGDVLDQSPVTAEDIINSVPVEKIDAAEFIERDMEYAASADRQQNLADVIIDIIKADGIAQADVRKDVSDSPLEYVSAEDKEIGDFSEPFDAPKEYIPTVKEPNDAAAATRRRQQYEREREIENYWADVFREDNYNTKNRRNNNFSASLYAGNFGTGTGDMVYNDITKLAATGMMVNEVSMSVPTGGPSKAPSAYDSGIDATLRHRMPINAGVTLAFPITPKLSVVTGLNYSYLYSSSTQQSQNRTYKFSREQHYLGVPVGVMYDLYSSKRLNIYVRGGGAIERAVYISEKNSASADVQKIAPKGVQFSVDAGIGANLRLGKGIGLYLEPGAAYYFSNANQLDSYRTENPTNFTVRIGVRFDIK